MIFVIEGPDGSGKSTLARQIANSTGFKIIHKEQPKTEEEMQSMLQEYIDILKSGKNCILDRSWYSEMVYGPIIRGASHISYPDMYRLETILSRKGALVVYCGAPTNVLWERCKARGETFITQKETLHRISEAFEELMQGVPHKVPVVYYEYKEM